MPEVHAEFTFRNIPEGYNFTEWDYRYFATFYNSNSIRVANGTLILLMKVFNNNKTSSEIGAKIMYRIWTLRVPETAKIPKPKTNFEIVLVPIVVKAYSCELERVTESDHGSFAFLSGTGIDAILKQ